MKKIIAAVLSVIIFCIIFCSCSNGEQSSTEKTANTVTFLYENATDRMSILFGIDKASYEYALVTASGGKLYVNEGSEDTSFSANETAVFLYDGSGCAWAPADVNDESDNPSIYIQLCDGDTTLHCGTISLVPLFDISLDEAQNEEYRVTMQSDDGLAIKNDENGNIIIFVEE